MPGQLCASALAAEQVCLAVPATTPHPGLHRVPTPPHPTGGGLGGLLGGWIGDRAAARFPDHGRIVATQFSVIVGVPFSLLLFKVWCRWSYGAGLLGARRSLRIEIPQVPRRIGPLSAAAQP